MRSGYCSVWRFRHSRRAIARRLSNSGFSSPTWSGGSVQGVNGASLDFDNDTAIGIFGGYNITNRFAVGAEMTWADPAYQLKRATDGTGLTRTLDAELDIGTLLLKATFNFLEGPFTPYVEAGAGWIRIDSNVVSDVDTGCWWDPWWGYVCADFYDTYSDTRTGYTYAAGVRWDISDEMLLRAATESSRRTPTTRSITSTSMTCASNSVGSSDFGFATLTVD